MVFSPNGISLFELAKLESFDPYQVWPGNPLLLIKSPDVNAAAPVFHSTPGGSAVFSSTVDALGGHAITGYIAKGAVIVPVLKSRRNKREGIVIGRAPDADIPIIRCFCE